MISIVVLTHNRDELLSQCVQNVLARTSEETGEIVIWDNGSTDGTPAFLDTVADVRVRVVRSETNLGMNAYRPAAALTSGEYLIELDDDVIDAPAGWDRSLREAFDRLPEIGYLAADLVDDPEDENAYLRHHARVNAYRLDTIGGVRIYRGPTGGSCAITSRDLYDLVGGFQTSRGSVYWSEDGTYIADIGKFGFGAAILADVRVHHHGGPPTPEKRAFAMEHWRRVRRRDRIKCVLLGVPGVAALNARFTWFEREAWWLEFLERFDLFIR